MNRIFFGQSKRLRLFTNRILDVDELKSRLCRLLAVSPFRVTDKSSWLSYAKEIAHGRYSKPVCRFLLFAAANNTRADADHPGLLKAESVIASDELNFLSYSTWVAQRYATVEHVAPSTQTSAGWDSKIYERPSTQHTIGNLVLLPRRENQSIGNAPWDQKRLFYQALTARRKQERMDAFKLAQSQGLPFGKQTRVLIENQDRLHMLDPIVAVDDWTVELIEARTENVLGLAWDNIASWLFE